MHGSITFTNMLVDFHVRGKIQIVSYKYAAYCFTGY